MANTYATDPARGLSKLQKAILVYLAEERDRLLESYRGLEEKIGSSRMLELFGDIGEEPVHIRWRPWPSHSFYGGTHPLGKALGFASIHYTAKERAAVSRSLSRLSRRGLVDVYVTEGKRRARTVVLTAKGVEIAEALREQGISRDYKDLWPEGLEEVRDLCYSLLADRGIAPGDVPDIDRAIERDPAKALKATLRWVAKQGDVRQGVNRFEEESDG